MGPVRHPDAGRLRRRRDQDRAAGRRRPVAHLASRTIRPGSTTRSSAASTATSARSCSTCASDGDKDAVLRLLDDADVVVNNFRAGVMERMGFGYEVLLEASTRGIIYAVGTGFGLSRPLRAQGRPGRAGAGDDGRDGARAPMPRLPMSVYATALADYSAGMHLVQGILLALLQRERTGAARRSACRSTTPCSPMQMQEAAMIMMRGREVNWGAMPLTGVFETTDGALVMVGRLQGQSAAGHLRRARSARRCRETRASRDSRRAGRATRRSCTRSSASASATEHDGALARPARGAGPALRAGARRCGEALGDEQTRDNGDDPRRPRTGVETVRVVGSARCICPMPPVSVSDPAGRARPAHRRGAGRDRRPRRIEKVA